MNDAGVVCWGICDAGAWRRGEWDLQEHATSLQLAGRMKCFRLLVALHVLFYSLPWLISKAAVLLGAFLACSLTGLDVVPVWMRSCGCIHLTALFLRLTEVAEFPPVLRVQQIQLFPLLSYTQRGISGLEALKFVTK